MIDTLGSFVAELREMGLPVSTAEALDAANALQHVEIGREESVREALAATLIKAPRHRRAFDVAFDVFFGGAAASPHPAQASVPDVTPGQAGDLRDGLAAALQAGDMARVRALVRTAVTRLAGFQAGRPVGGRYYLYRVLQRLDGIEEMLSDRESSGALDSRLARDDTAHLMALLTDELRREIIRRLVADRGAEPVARTLREPLVEDIDLMHANRDELERIEAAVAPLAQKLASRLAQRRRQGSRGRLDMRRTIRRSLAHGGALIDPKFRRPRRSKPEIVLLCDVSGSMATFAKFTLQFTYAVGNQFSNVRSFAFIDAVDEITGFLDARVGLARGITEMSSRARLVGGDGHSDYGAVLRQFAAEHADAVTPRSTLIIAGDARNNYRDTEEAVFAEIAARARSVLWLNPEACRFWDTGDSVISRYAQHCDGVHEVRTLRHLERFVTAVVTGPGTPTRVLN